MLAKLEILLPAVVVTQLYIAERSHTWLQSGPEVRSSSQKREDGGQRPVLDHLRGDPLQPGLVVAGVGAQRLEGGAAGDVATGGNDPP
ncbi:hypothetical protein [Streptomyces sp. NPDC046939]|uniref:hypothetical protein n=1 Tax=Streptomyces sp. NPDC046939 TaxID=3155376 RepID=UPI00340B4A3B